MIRSLHWAVSDALQIALEAVETSDEQTASRLLDMKAEIDELVNAAIVHQAHRLVGTDPNRMRTYSVEMDMIENLERISYVSTRIARCVVATSPSPPAPDPEATRRASIGND